jgi:hypothetical protein
MQPSCHGARRPRPWNPTWPPRGVISGTIFALRHQSQARYASDAASLSCSALTLENMEALQLELRGDLDKRGGLDEGRTDRTLGDFQRRAFLVTSAKWQRAAPRQNSKSTMCLGYDFVISINACLRTVERELHRSIQASDILLMSPFQGVRYRSVVSKIVAMTRHSHFDSPPA